MFARADEAVLDRLRAMLPAAAFRDGAPYLREPRGQFAGQGIVVAPSSVEEVSRVVALCHDAGCRSCHMVAGRGWSVASSAMRAVP